MRKKLFLVLVLLLAFNVKAQEGVNISFICKSALAVHFVVTADSTIDTLTLDNPFYAKLPTQWVVWQSNPAPKRFSTSYPRGTEYFYVQGNTKSAVAFSYAVSVPRNLSDCGEIHNPYDPPPGVECLGVPYPGAGVFMVDGNEYTWHDVLSFVVPNDAIWRWELYVAGQLLVVFEQTEIGNCHIIEDYRP